MNRNTWLTVLLIFCAAWLPYAISLGNERIGDDRDLVVLRLGPEQVASPAQLWEENYWGNFAESGLYRPLPLTLLYAQRQLFGLATAPYRVVNLLLYALCGLLCLGFLRQLVSPSAALAATVLFLVHPAHVEVVLTAYGQAEMLAAIFVLTALIAHVHYTREGRVSWLAVAAVSFLGALLSKEISASFPLLAIATRGLWLAADRAGWRRWLAPADMVYVGVGVLYGVWKYLAIGMLAVPLSGSPMAGLPLFRKLFAVIGVGLSNYVRLSIFPVSQSIVYDVFPDARWDSLWIVCALALCVWFARVVGGRKVLFGMAWFLSTWFIFSNLLVPTGVYVAERCLFLPLLGICLLFGLYFERVRTLGWKGPTVGLYLLLAISACQSAVTSWEWRSEEDSLRAAIQEHPNSPMARANLGLALLITPQMEQKTVEPDDRQEAEKLLMATAREYPNLPEAYRGLGLLDMLRGDYRGAAEKLKRGLSLRPGDAILQEDLLHCERAMQQH